MQSVPLLEGWKESVERAERLVREFLEDSKAADREKVRQLGLMNPDSSSSSSSSSSRAASTLAVNGVVPTGGYTSKPMAQILGQTAGSSSLSAYGPSGASDLGATLEEKIGIPTAASP